MEQVNLLYLGAHQEIAHVENDIYPSTPQKVIEDELVYERRSNGFAIHLRQTDNFNAAIAYPFECVRIRRKQKIPVSKNARVE